jgi:hypothetical protein
MAAPSAEYRAMTTSAHDELELELALLRRGLDERLAASGTEQCSRCHRTPLIGERIYQYESGAIACELCRRRERAVPQDSHVIHGPAFGHTMRITDQRRAA